MSAMIHPMPVHPNKRFSRNIAVVCFLLEPAAKKVGRKYNTRDRMNRKTVRNIGKVV